MMWKTQKLNIYLFEIESWLFSVLISLINIFDIFDVKRCQQNRRKFIDMLTNEQKKDIVLINL